ncbi:MAG TPA: AAA family ATPase [Sediminibacterium sp.]|nr:AAA family ATPase [Sediminibacterium sp.]
MSEISKGIMSKGHLIDDKYKVMFFVKASSFAETYRVKNDQGKLGLIKIFNYSKLNTSQFDTEGGVLEISILKMMSHPNVVKYWDSGELIISNQKFAYLVLDFISGETLADKMKRETTMSLYEAKQIILGVLNGLRHIHNLPVPIIHNDISNQNIMLDLSGKIPIPKIIDFGYARKINQPNKSYQKTGLNPFYMASECFNNIFTIQSDIYSVGALFYHLLFGLPPWFVEISKYKADRSKVEEMVLEERKKVLRQLNIESSEVFEKNNKIINIIKKAIHPDVDLRFKSAEEFISALNNEAVVEPIELNQKHQSSKSSIPSKDFKPTSKGKGFDLIAGMDNLKSILFNDVIRALNESELFDEYGLTIPNGMLLYGPPGCGKTFIAERFAEEAGFNYVYVRSSDLASIYVHGTQEKIGQLFKEARENAPTIICFDELDALVPNRDKIQSASQSGEVNEFLTQMNNAGKDGVFVIGTTNKPDLIDPAIIRTGRVDKLVYLPPPDFKARVAMFEIHLKARPLELGINFEKLAYATENFVSSDIEFLVNESAREALKNRSKISQQILDDIIANAKPSVSARELKKYEEIKRKFEDGDDDGRNPIGFRRD